MLQSLFSRLLPPKSDSGVEYHDNAQTNHRVLPGAHTQGHPFSFLLLLLFLPLLTAGQVRLGQPPGESHLRPAEDDDVRDGERADSDGEAGGDNASFPAAQPGTVGGGTRTPSVLLQPRDQSTFPRGQSA